jgi:hypothetical protein
MTTSRYNGSNCFACRPLSLFGLMQSVGLFEKELSLVIIFIKQISKQNSVAFSLQANYTDRAAATCR